MFEGEEVSCVVGWLCLVVVVSCGLVVVVSCGLVVVVSCYGGVGEEI